MAMKKSNPNFMNGIPELVVLRLLSRKEMYGYELVKAIQAESQGILTFGEGCIYPTLHALEHSRLIVSRRKEVGGRNRLYYELTARGRRQLEALSKDWNQVVAGVSLALGGKHA
jgi:PadR family transcriptional regulator PadR